MSEHLELIRYFSAEQLATLLREQGYRVTVDEDGRLLRSASQGLAFLARFGNAAETDGQWLDVTLGLTLQVDGELPAELVNRWNSRMRFARLSHQGDALVLEQDLMVAGGVHADAVRAQLTLWDRLIQELVFFLREQLAADDSQRASA